METYRLKNICILILALLNVFLLILLGYQTLQTYRSESNGEDRLQDLYAINQITIDEQVDLSCPCLPPLLIARNVESEQEMASFLLGGEAVPATSQGGGIYRFESENGTLDFRSGGSFEGQALSVPVPDVPAFFAEFCRRFSYVDTGTHLTDGTGTAKATEQIHGVNIAACGVELQFSEGCLVAVTGSHVTLEDATVISTGEMTCITALVRFLDYRNEHGAVCGTITGMQCSYTLQHTSTTPKLLPTWQIETDTHTYTVDCATGEVQRQQDKT